MKILLLPNFPGWAFDHIAQAVKKFGTHDYDILYEKDYRKYRGKELPKEELDFDKYDRIILFAPWMHWSNLPLNKTICIFHEKFEMDGYNNKQYFKTFVTSDISLGYIKDKKNVIKVQAGVDTDVFNAAKYSKIVNLVNPVIGWVGAMSGHKNKKGYEEFYLPLGEYFTLKPHLKEKHYVKNHSDMAAYYASIDVLVCTSSWEGYPMPILEATAMGVPVVTTNVGIAWEVVPHHQIIHRDVDSFVERLNFKEFVVGCRPCWSWKNKIKEWEDAIK